jgi:holo-[acyl-carrier protein] synthase
MTVVGNGIDLVEVERIEKLVSRQKEKFLQRVYTPEEVDFCMKKARPAIHFAARFAAKEAVAKALGTGFSKGIRMRDIEVVSTAAGPPQVRLSGAAAKLYDALGGKKVLLSLSHTAEQAIAHAIISS